MEHMKTTEEIIKQLSQEKNLAPATIDIYKRSINFFEKHTKKKLPEFLDIVKNEEKTQK